MVLYNAFVYSQPPSADKIPVAPSLLSAYTPFPKTSYRNFFGICIYKL